MISDYYINFFNLMQKKYSSWYEVQKNNLVKLIKNIKKRNKTQWIRYLIEDIRNRSESTGIPFILEMRQLAEAYLEYARNSKTKSVRDQKNRVIKSIMTNKLDNNIYFQNDTNKISLIFDLLKKSYISTVEFVKKISAQ